MADPRAHAHPQTGEPVDDGFGDDPLAELTRIVAERTAPQPSWTPPRPGGVFGRATPQAVTATRAPASARLPAMEVYVPPPPPPPPPPEPPVMARPDPVPPPAVEPPPPPVAAPRPQVRPLFPTAAQAALDARAAGAATVAQQSYAFFAEQRSRGAAPRSLGDPEETRPAGSAPAGEMEDPLAELARLASDPSLFERSFRRAGTPPPAPAAASYDPVAEEEAGYYDAGYAPAPPAQGRASGHAAPPAARGYHDDDAEDLARNEAPVGTSTVDAYVPGDLESHAVPEVEETRPQRSALRAAADLYADDHWDRAPEPVRAPVAPAAGSTDPYYDDAPVWRDPSDGGAMDDAGGLPAGAPADLPTIPGEELPRRPRFSGLRGVVVIVGILVVSLGGLLGSRLLDFGASNGPPRVFEDDGQPFKGPPETAAPEGEEEAAPGKTIYDRVDGKTDTAAARLVERPTAPVDSLPGVGGGGALPATGETVMEPRRVRTVVVRPDGTIMPGQTVDPTAVPDAAADTLPEPVPAADRDAMAGLAATDAAPADATGGEGIAPSGDGALSGESAAASEPVGSPQGPLRLPERRPPAPAMRSTTTAAAPAKPAPAAPAAQAPAAGPMSLIPGSAGGASAPTQAVTAPAGGFGVQVTSQRSREQALAAYQQLQRKFPSVLGGRPPAVQSVEISGKGTYYRVRVPAGSQAQAAQLCSQLKAAGGDCVVTRN